LEGGVRDPHILRGENNDYFMVATDMVAAKGWASNHGIVMLKSTNLVDWKSSTVDIQTAFPQYQKADRVWAPQTIYDPAVKKYMVYFAMRLQSSDKDKIYYSYADSTFTKLETAPKILYQYGSNSAIDADIIYKDNQYYLFFKTEGSGNGIKSAVSSKLTEGYVLYDKYLQLTTAAVEGSCVFKLNNSPNYILMYDVYTSGRYEFAQSTDLKNFTADKDLPTFDFTPRHGTIMPITAAEKNALNAKWNPTRNSKFISKSQQSNASLRPATQALLNHTGHPEFKNNNTNSQQHFSLTGKKVEKQLLPTGDLQRGQQHSGPSSGIYLLRTK
jgi:hypothetical protein